MLDVVMALPEERLAAPDRRDKTKALPVAIRLTGWTGARSILGGTLGGLPAFALFTFHRPTVAGVDAHHDLVLGVVGGQGGKIDPFRQLDFGPIPSGCWNSTGSKTL